jgi:VCBS repeat-containing protein
VAYDDLITAQIDLRPVVTERTEADGATVVVNLGNFSDTFAFTVPSGSTTDATFTVNAGTTVGLLNNPTAVLEVQTSTGWVQLGDASEGGLLDLLGGERGFTVTAEDLQAGNYRLTYGGGGTLGVGTTISLDAQLSDTSLTEFEVASALAVTGNVFAASEGGPADERGPNNSAVLQVLGDDGTYVTVTGPTEVDGQFGTLVIAPDGSFTYTPDPEAANIGQVDSFSYQLLGPDGPSTATINVRVDSPDADVIWDNTDFGAPGTVVVAVGDTAEAGIVLGARVDDAVTVPNAIEMTALLSLGALTDTYEFNVAPATTRDLTLDLTSNSLVDLSAGTTFTLQRLEGTRWVNVTGTVDDPAIGLLGLSGGGIRAEVEDLAPGSYRLGVRTSGLGVGTNVTGSATFVTTYPNEVEATDVVPTAGNVLAGVGGLGGDVLGSEQTVLQIEQSDGVFVTPGSGGQLVTGEHGILRIEADGDFTYTPFEEEAGIGQTDRFTYQLVHPNGETSTAELAVTIGEAPAGAPVAPAEGQPDSPLVDLNADVTLLDGLTALSLTADDGQHLPVQSADVGMTLPGAEPEMRDPSQLELHGDTVVLVGLAELPLYGSSEDGSLVTIGSDTDGITLPAFEDLLEIEPQEAVRNDPPAETEDTRIVHADTAVTVEIEPAILIENPLHDPWANAATHV